MKKKFYFSLKFKLTSVIILLVGIISLFLYIYFPQIFEEEQLNSLNEKVNSVTKITAYGVSSGVYFDDYEATSEVLDALIKTEIIKYIILLKEDSVYYKYKKSTADSCLFDSIDRNYISKKMEILKSNAAITMSGEKIGDIYIGYSLRRVNAKIEELKNSIGLVSIGLFVIGSFLVYLIGYYFTLPLSKIFETVNKIRDGDLRERSNVITNDEIGYLANSFNQMLDKIESTNEEMETINRELEQRVKDRTFEVEKALKSLQKENKARKKIENDISRSLKEKEVLLKEIHHRVKNNLQIVSSLFYFQSKKITDPVTLEIFRDGQNRVKSMALIHEKLYQSGDLANIDFKEYVKKLSNFLFQSYGVNQSKFKLKNNVTNVQLNVNMAVPCGLIINELISNSFKHGFKGMESGEIRIDMEHDENNKLILKVSDNGKGMPKDLNIAESDSLGLRLVNNLTIQLNGKVEFFNRNGTTVKITFEDPKYKYKEAS